MEMKLLGIAVAIHLPESRSLKDKRQIIKSMLERTRHRFSISAAEVDWHDHHQTALLGFGVVSSTQQHAQQILEQVLRLLDTYDAAQVYRVTWLQAEQQEISSCA